MRYVCAHTVQKARLDGTGATSMSVRLWDPNTKAAHTGCGAAPNLAAGFQYCSRLRRTRWRRSAGRSASAHSRRRGNAGSARTPSAVDASPVTPSASRAAPRSTSAAASTDLPAPLLPSSSTAPAPVSTAAARSVTTPRCCSSAASTGPTRKVAMSSVLPPRGSITISRAVTRYRATSATCSSAAPGSASQAWGVLPSAAGRRAGVSPRRTVTSGRPARGPCAAANGRAMEECQHNPKAAYSNIDPEPDGCKLPQGGRQAAVFSLLAGKGRRSGRHYRYVGRVDWVRFPHRSRHRGA